jgi:hypothetical protein
VTHLPLPDDETATPALAAEYAAARQRTGSVMAILRAMGPRVAVLHAFLDLADAVLYGPAAMRSSRCAISCPTPRSMTRSRSSGC